MPPEEIEAILAIYQCPACLRQHAGHSAIERQICHHYLLGLPLVTILHEAEKQQALLPPDEKIRGQLA